MDTNGRLDANIKKMITEPKFIFTHDDLDGIGCATLLLRLFPDVTVKCLPAGKTTIKVIDDIIRSMPDDFDCSIFITDLGIPEDEDGQDFVATIEAYNATRKRQILYVDHHKTSLWLQNKPWAVVDTTYCATKLLKIVLSELFMVDDFYPFVEMVNAYDTWQPDRELGTAWTSLLRAIGTDYFISRAKNFTISSSKYEQLEPAELIAVVSLHKEKEEYLLKKCQEYIEATEEIDGKTYDVAIVTATKHHNDIAHTLIDNGVADIVYIIDLEQMIVSIRSKEVDISGIAKARGGGGHPLSAGHPLKLDTAALLNHLYYSDI